MLVIEEQLDETLCRFKEGKSLNNFYDLYIRKIQTTKLNW